MSLSHDGAAKAASSCSLQMVHLVNCRRMPPLGSSAIREPLPSRGSGVELGDPEGIRRGIVGYVESWDPCPRS